MIAFVVTFREEVWCRGFGGLKNAPKSGKKTCLTIRYFPEEPFERIKELN